MKISQFLIASSLMAVTSALTPGSLLSTGRNAALAALNTTKHEISKANIPAALATTAEQTKEFTTDSFPRTTAQALQICKASLGTVVACGVAGVGLLLVSAPAAVAAPALAAAGFGANGIALASTAASVQSGIGSVVAPGLFATLQSAGAGGYGLATVYGTVQVAGGVIASSAMGVIAWTMAKL